MLRPKIFLTRLERGYLEQLRRGIIFTGFDERLRSGVPVIIKPNLTFPEFTPGVMTNIDCIEELIIALRDYTSDITIVESDGGGYNKFKIDEVFRRTGLCEIASRYGVRLLNLSRLESLPVVLEGKRRSAEVQIPRLFLENPYLLVNVPVPKIHYLTVVSLALKNQWGCLPDPFRRLKLHPRLNWLLWELNSLLKPSLVLLDGRYALDRNGPLRGELVNTGWLLMTTDILAGDIAACRLLGIDPARISHIAYAMKSKGVSGKAEFQFSNDPAFFVGRKFTLKRELWDYPGYFAFRSPLVNWIGFRSPLAAFLHRLLYLFRTKFYDYSQERKLFSDEEWKGK